MKNMNYQEVIFWLRLIGFVMVSLEYIFSKKAVQSIGNAISKYAKDRNDYSMSILNRWTLLFQEKKTGLIFSIGGLSSFLSLCLFN